MHVRLDQLSFVIVVNILFFLWKGSTQEQIFVWGLRTCSEWFVVNTINWYVEDLLLFITL